jgi:hypothetical protein
MKYAVPPTAETARMPTTITEAMRIEIHVFRSCWLMMLLAAGL